jgi:hypothetical protein
MEMKTPGIDIFLRKLYREPRESIQEAMRDMATQPQPGDTQATLQEMIKSGLVYKTADGKYGLTAKGKSQLDNPKKS